MSMNTTVKAEKRVVYFLAIAKHVLQSRSSSSVQPIIFITDSSCATSSSRSTQYGEPHQSPGSRPSSRHTTRFRLSLVLD